MSKPIPTARDLSNEIQLRATKTVGPWKLNADDAQWAQAGKWSHAVAIGILGAWFMAVAALTGGPVSAATPELTRAGDATVYVPDPVEPVMPMSAAVPPAL